MHIKTMGPSLPIQGIPISVLSADKITDYSVKKYIYIDIIWYHYLYDKITYHDFKNYKMLSDPKYKNW